MVLTHDLDFAELIAVTGAQLPSVITFRLRDMRPENVNRHLQAALRRHANELEHGAVISVTEGRARVRLLPIEDDG